MVTLSQLFEEMGVNNFSRTREIKKSVVDRLLDFEPVVPSRYIYDALDRSGVLSHSNSVPSDCCNPGNNPYFKISPNFRWIPLLGAIQQVVAEKYEPSEIFVEWVKPGPKTGYHGQMLLYFRDGEKLRCFIEDRLQQTDTRGHYRFDLTSLIKPH